MFSQKTSGVTSQRASRARQLLVGFLTLVVACARDDADPAEPTCDEVIEYRAYRITGLELPTTASAANAMGLNLDEDQSGRPDNAAGSLYWTLLSNFSTAADQLPASLETALNGPVAWILVVGTCADVDSTYAEVTLARGTPVDGGFAIGPAVPAFGTRAGDVVAATRGEGIAPASTLADVLGTHDAVWMSADAFAVDMTLDADGVIGRLGFALSDGYQHVVALPLADYFTSRLQAGTSEFAATMDTDGDDVVSEEELLASELMIALLLPDLDLDEDGERDHFSVSLAFRAERVDLVQR